MAKASEKLKSSLLFCRRGGHGRSARNGGLQRRGCSGWSWRGGSGRLGRNLIDRAIIIIGGFLDSSTRFLSCWLLMRVHGRHSLSLQGFTVINIVQSALKDMGAVLTHYLTLQTSSAL